MKIIFEDNKKDVLCKLYLVTYLNKSVQGDFIFAEGNAKAFNKTKELLKDSTEDIVMFLDMPPGNRDAIKIYKELRIEANNTDERLIVFPIPCFEYYFIISICNSEWLFNSMDGIQTCIDKGYFRNESLLETEEDKRYVTTFEKYCKLILKKSVIDCVKHCNMGNGYYGLYYTQDCLCNKRLIECKSKELKDKSRDMLLKFPCFPLDSGISGVRKLNKQQLWAIHDRLVAEFNRMTELYKEKAGSDEEIIGNYKLKYKTIRAFNHS